MLSIVRNFRILNGINCAYPRIDFSHPSKVLTSVWKNAASTYYQVPGCRHGSIDAASSVPSPAAQVLEQCIKFLRLLDYRKVQLKEFDMIRDSMCRDVIEHIHTAKEDLQSDIFSVVMDAVERLTRLSGQLSLADLREVAPVYMLALETLRTFHKILCSTECVAADFPEEQRISVTRARKNLEQRTGQLCLNITNVHGPESALLSDVQGVRSTENVREALAQMLPAAASINGLKKLDQKAEHSAIVQSARDNGLPCSVPMRNQAGHGTLKNDYALGMCLIASRQIHPNLPIVIGFLSDYSKAEFTAFYEEGTGQLFIHNDLVCAVFHYTRVHGGAQYELLDGVIGSLNGTGALFRGSVGVSHTITNRVGCGAVINKEHDGAVSFRPLPPDYVLTPEFLALEVAYTHECLLVLFAEASAWLAQDTSFQFCIVVKIESEPQFEARMFVFERMSTPKSKEELGTPGCSVEEAKKVRTNKRMVIVKNRAIRDDEVKKFSPKDFEDVFDIRLIKRFEIEAENVSDDISFDLDVRYPDGNVRTHEINLRGVFASIKVDADADRQKSDGLR